mmetsp:Transcript_17160/g.65014  ORF Transcript_17160/g.65014 Transcript_17160/m.65014 type:complete len:427 (+) Transcript_17160:2618-3898(+)
MSFTRVMSTMLKYSTEPRVATGRYCSRCSEICSRASAAATSFCFTSAALALVVASTPTSSSSSSRLPVLAERRCSSRSLSLSSDLVLALTSSSTLASWSSRAFCSRWITRPSSWSSRPCIVTVKSTTVVLACSSGEKCGLGRRVMKKTWKDGLSSISLSAMVTYLRLPRDTMRFSSSGSRSGSMVSSTPTTMRLLPWSMANSSWSLSAGLPSVVVPCGGRFSASRFLIHVTAWPWGSMRSGNREQLVTRMPFWIDSESVGRPCRAQSPRTPTSTRNSMMSRPVLTGTWRAAQSAANRSRMSSSRNRALNGPQYEMNAQATATSPTSRWRTPAKESLSAVQRVRSSARPSSSAAALFRLRSSFSAFSSSSRFLALAPSNWALSPATRSWHSRSRSSAWASARSACCSSASAVARASSLGLTILEALW